MKYQILDVKYAILYMPCTQHYIPNNWKRKQSGKPAFAPGLFSGSKNDPTVILVVGFRQHKRLNTKFAKNIMFLKITAQIRRLFFLGKGKVLCLEENME